MSSCIGPSCKAAIHSHKVLASYSFYYSFIYISVFFLLYVSRHFNRSIFVRMVVTLMSCVRCFKKKLGVKSFFSSALISKFQIITASKIKSCSSVTLLSFHWNVPLTKVFDSGRFVNSLRSRLIFASFHLLSYVSSESLDDESVNTFSISPESTPQKRTDL